MSDIDTGATDHERFRREVAVARGHLNLFMRKLVRLSKLAQTKDERAEIWKLVEHCRSAITPQ